MVSGVSRKIFSTACSPGLSTAKSGKLATRKDPDFARAQSGLRIRVTCSTLPTAYCPQSEINMNTDKIILDDVLAPELRVVFCGTALGRTSAKLEAYYAHSRNRFWSILHEVGLTDAKAPIVPSDYHRVLQFKIGLTDLCKTVSGNDSDLPSRAFDTVGLQEKIKKFRPAILAFTSKTAGKKFCGPRTDLGWQDPFGSTRIYVLPSTSPMAGWQWDKNKHHWWTLAEAVRQL